MRVVAVRPGRVAVVGDDHPLGVARPSNRACAARERRPERRHHVARTRPERARRDRDTPRRRSRTPRAGSRPWPDRARTGGSPFVYVGVSGELMYLGSPSPIERPPNAIVRPWTSRIGNIRRSRNRSYYPSPVLRGTTRPARADLLGLEPPDWRWCEDTVPAVRCVAESETLHRLGRETAPIEVLPAATPGVTLEHRAEPCGGGADESELPIDAPSPLSGRPAGRALGSERRIAAPASRPPRGSRHFS